MIWLLCVHYHFQPNISFLPFTTPGTSRFYLPPKIHKTNNTGRPIVSACSCPMENISAFLDEVMTPLVRGLPTYVKDTNHDFHIFDSFRFHTTDPGQRFLITMDVKSLNTVIPNDCGLQALTCSSETHDVKVPSTSTLIRPAELVLKLNAFSFNKEYLREQNGAYLCLRFRWVHWVPNPGTVHRLCSPITQEVYGRHCWSSFMQERGNGSLYQLWG